MNPTKPLSVLLMCCVALALLVGEAAAAESLSDQVRAAGAGSPEGSVRVVQLFQPALLAPPAKVSREAQAICGRYLPTALRSLPADASCEVRAQAHEAMGMCHFLAGKDAEASAQAQALALLRCPDAPVDGLSRAVGLAERWMWAEPVRALVEAQAAGGGTADKRLQLRSVDGLRAAIDAAVGTRSWGQGVLVTGINPRTPAGRTGLRSGDVIVSVVARTIRGVDELEQTISAGTQQGFAFWRAGARDEGLWQGPFEGLTVVAVPERRAGK